jgi:putative proteasome-type protease
MTFCLGMRVEEGLVGLADTRVTSGSECITARKVSVYEVGGHSFFLMTSGLRSVRDKALTYFDERIEHLEFEANRLYKVVNLLAEQTRRVAQEDRGALEASGFRFDLHALVGGQLSDDKDHKLYLLYPQGNWVEIGLGTPYCIIGESGYGKPILDRTLKYSDRMPFALKVGCLAFDSTRISATNVDFPLDIVVYDRSSRAVVQHRFEKADLAPISNWWQERLRTSLSELPSDWTRVVFGPDNGDCTATIKLNG